MPKCSLRGRFTTENTEDTENAKTSNLCALCVLCGKSSLASVAKECVLFVAAAGGFGFFFGEDRFAGKLYLVAFFADAFDEDLLAFF